MAEHHGGRVLGTNLRVPSLGLAVHALDVPKEDAREIEDVDPRVENGETLLVVEIRLTAIDVEASPEGNTRPARRPDGVGGKDLPDTAHRRGETEVLVNREPGSLRLRLGNDRQAILPAWCKGLLDNRRDASVGGKRREHPVRIHPGRDVDEVDALLSQHRSGIGVPRNTERLARGACLPGVQVAHSDKIGALRGEVAPGVEMVLPIEAATDLANADGLVGTNRTHSNSALPTALNFAILGLDHSCLRLKARSGHFAKWLAVIQPYGIQSYCAIA